MKVQQKNLSKNSRLILPSGPKVAPKTKTAMKKSEEVLALNRASKFLASKNVKKEQASCFDVGAVFLFAMITSKDQRKIGVRFTARPSKIYDSFATARNKVGEEEAIKKVLNLNKAKKIDFFYTVPNRKTESYFFSLNDLVEKEYGLSVKHGAFFNKYNFSTEKFKFKDKAITFAVHSLGFQVPKDMDAASLSISDLSEEERRDSMTLGLASSAISFPAFFVDFFLTHGANPDPKGYASNSGYPLSEAVSRGDIGIVRTLLVAGANPRHQLTHYDPSPIDLSEEGSEIQKLLLSFAEIAA